MRLVSVGVVSLEYYARCIDILKSQFERITLFVFSDDLEWAKCNLYFGTPIEFVEGCERDVDELFLMSQCRHNIIANSTFSWWGAWLNPNSDKQVFAPDPWIKNNLYNHDIIAEGWTKMPVDFKTIPRVELPPHYSIVIFVDNDIDTLKDSLSSLKRQLFRHYELIVIDNCSTDGSAELCQRELGRSNKARLIRMKKQIGRGAAWNIGINAARGEYVLFLSGADRIVPSTFFSIHSDIEDHFIDVLFSAGFLSDNGEPSFEKHFDEPCKGINLAQPINASTQQLLQALEMRKLNRHIGTKMFCRQFLVENGIRFSEVLDGSDGEFLFLAECLSKTSKRFMTPQLFYVKPNARQ